MIRRSDSATPLLRTPALRAVERAAAGQPLMERAGAAAAAAAVSIRADRAAPVLIVAGPATTAAMPSSSPGCCASRDSPSMSSLPANRNGCRPTPPRPTRLSPPPAEQACRQSGAARLEPDRRRAVRIGLTRPPEGRLGELIATMNATADASGCPLLALDCRADSMPIPE